MRADARFILFMASIWAMFIVPVWLAYKFWQWMGWL